jgi:hypothetical protein
VVVPPSLDCAHHCFVWSVLRSGYFPRSADRCQVRQLSVSPEVRALDGRRTDEPACHAVGFKVLSVDRAVWEGWEDAVAGSMPVVSCLWTQQRPLRSVEWIEQVVECTGWQCKKHSGEGVWYFGPNRDSTRGGATKEKPLEIARRCRRRLRGRAIGHADWDGA